MNNNNKALDDDIVANKNRCNFIAHRGLSGLAPENTIPAFELAGEKGYWGVECDIHVTKDGQFVVFHDDTLDRMTNVKGFIKDYNLEELLKIEIINGINVTLFKELKIPLLEDLLKICNKYNMVPVIEIKNLSCMDYLNKLNDLLIKYNIINEAIIISFNLNYLIQYRNLNSNIKIQYLTNEINEDIINICTENRFDVDVNYGKLTKTLIENCHDNNIMVNTWTVDDPSISKYLVESNIDFITTNILQRSK